MSEGDVLLTRLPFKIFKYVNDIILRIKIVFAEFYQL